MHLVVGSTGALGGEICRLLRAQNRPVRALARVTSNPDRIAELHKLGAEVVRGDLTDRASLQAACRGVGSVISSATAIQSQLPADSIEKVDRDGQLALVDAAAAAGVKQFVFISFPDTGVEFPLQSAKRAVEERLRASAMTWTILQPTFFAEVWLGPHLGLDLARGTAKVYGEGMNPVSWISFRDVARCAVAALDNPNTANRTVVLGGPASLSPMDVVRQAEEVTGKTFTVERIPEAAIRGQYEAATDARQKTFAGLMLYYARGHTVDMSTQVRDFALGKLRSITEYLQGT
jgi:NADH dehydrogenase